MPKITFDSNVDSSPEALVLLIDSLDEGTITTQSLTEVVIETGDFTFTFGLVAFGLLVDTIVITENGQPFLEISDVDLPTLDLLAAIEAESDGSNPAALEELIFGLDWTYIGNNNADILSQDLESADESPIDFTGDDVVKLRGGDDQFALSGGNDVGYGGKGADTIWGEAGNDELYGGKGADTLDGGVGNDILVGGKGNDTLIGGEGTDVASYQEDDAAGGTQGIVVDMAAGTVIDTFGHTDALTGIEEVLGSVFADKMSGSADSDSFYGGNGKDTLKGLAGDDTLRGENGADKLFGGAGDDILAGDSGGDTLKGGKGDDILIGSRGNDTLNGGSGEDMAYYGFEVSEGGEHGVEVDLAAGTATDAFGNTDTLIGIENVSGTSLGDIISGDAASNNIYGDDGDDIINGKKGDDELNGGSGNDSISGGKGADVIYGEAGEDTIAGGKGGDEMYGDAGDDHLTGQKGNDTLTGGAGSDIFYFGTGHGEDVITDFEAANDLIEILGDTADYTLSQQGDDVLIANGDDSILVQNTVVADFVLGDNFV